MYNPNQPQSLPQPTPSSTTIDPTDPTDPTTSKINPQLPTNQLKQLPYDQNKYPNFYKEYFDCQLVSLVLVGHVGSGKSELRKCLERMAGGDGGDGGDEDGGWRNYRMERLVDCARVLVPCWDRRYTVFDASGHGLRYHDMVMAACQADIAVLLISAKGNQFQYQFEKQGQIRQHAMLIRAIGVQSLIVVVTKMGAEEWCEKRFNFIRSQLTSFLSPIFTDIQYIPIDCFQNQNILTKPNTTWYPGPTLLQSLQSSSLSSQKLPQNSSSQLPLRIPIQSIQKIHPQIYLYGKIQSGKLTHEGQILTIIPSYSRVEVKEIYNVRDERLPYAVAGEFVKLRVIAAKGEGEDKEGNEGGSWGGIVQQMKIRHGDVICGSQDFCMDSCQFKAEVTILQVPGEVKVVVSGYQCVLHLHTATRQCEIIVEAKAQKQTGKFFKSKYLLPGQTGKTTIKLLSPNPICLQKSPFPSSSTSTSPISSPNPFPSLSNFLLRSKTQTIGWGKITKIKPYPNEKGLQHNSKTILAFFMDQIYQGFLDDLVYQVLGLGLDWYQI